MFSHVRRKWVGEKKGLSRNDCWLIGSQVFKTLQLGIEIWLGRRKFKRGCVSEIILFRKKSRNSSQNQANGTSEQNQRHLFLSHPKTKFMSKTIDCDDTLNGCSLLEK